MILVALVASVIAALTWLLGWWAVPLVALIVGAVVGRARGVAWKTAAAGAVAWGALLAFDAAAGSFGVVARTLGGVIGLPGFVLVLVTLAFPAALGWSAATLAAAARRALAARATARGE